MDKFYGAIGFAGSIETAPGVWQDTIIEKKYYGDIIRSSGVIRSSGQVNDDLQISSQISIISDPYAKSNFKNVRYVSLEGAKWKVTNVEMRYPRLLLTLGGLYNGPTTVT